MSDVVKPTLPDGSQFETMEQIGRFSQDYVAELADINFKITTGFATSQEHLQGKVIDALRTENDWAQASREFWFPEFGILLHKRADIHVPLQNNGQTQLTLDARVEKNVIYNRQDLPSWPPSLAYRSPSLVLREHGAEEPIARAPFIPEFTQTSEADSNALVLADVHKRFGERVSLNPLELLAYIGEVSVRAGRASFWHEATFTDYHELSLEEATGVSNRQINRLSS